MADGNCHCGAGLDMPVVMVAGKERRLSECRSCFIANLSPMTRAEVERLLGLVAATEAELQDRNARVLYLEGLINTPTIDDFFRGVRIEAAHQVEKWGKEHDASKDAPAWFWVIGYVAGKALRAGIVGDRSKLLHHIVTTAAVCFNWFCHVTSDPTRVPGGEPPKEASSGG